MASCNISFAFATAIAPRERNLEQKNGLNGKFVPFLVLVKYTKMRLTCFTNGHTGSFILSNQSQYVNLFGFFILNLFCQIWQYCVNLGYKTQKKCCPSGNRTQASQNPWFQVQHYPFLVNCSFACKTETLGSLYSHALLTIAKSS